MDATVKEADAENSLGAAFGGRANAVADISVIWHGGDETQNMGLFYSRFHLG